MEGSGIAVEGSFELPPLARLTVEDQVFVTAFVRCHGSIKEMEQLFGISYPTVKNRLASIAGKLEFVEINPPASRIETLARLEKGEISTDQALKILGGELMIPMIMRLDVRNQERKGVRLFFPVILLWIIVARAPGRGPSLRARRGAGHAPPGPGVRLLLFYPVFFAAVFALSGLRVDIASHGNKKVFISFD